MGLYSNVNSRYILTARLNQDAVENFFSSIRQRGGFNRNPTVKGFRTSYRILSVKNILKPPKTSSYEEDDDVMLPLDNNTAATSSCIPSTDQETEEEEDESSSVSSFVSDNTVEINEDVLTLEHC